MIETFGNEERQLLAQILMDNEHNRITPSLVNGIVVTFAHELARRSNIPELQNPGAQKEVLQQ